MNCNGRLLLIRLVTLGACVALAFVPRIPQPLAYHNFADQRAWLGIPNFLDVVSNLPFLLVGVGGIGFVLRHPEAFADPRERWPYMVLFIGVAATCLGSAYYHWHPTNDTLMWDRLPMTVGFMAILVAMIAERIDLDLAMRLLAPLLLVGMSSVLQWHQSELRGAGDLRFYLAVQFFPLVIILLLLWMFPPRYTRGADLLVVLGLYVAAKLLETADRAVFNAVGIVSGHTLKHLAAAAGVWWLLRMIAKRTPVGGASEAQAPLPMAARHG